MFKTKHENVMKLIPIMHPQLLYINATEVVNYSSMKNMLENLGYYILDCNIIHTQIEKFKGNIEININQGNPTCVIGDHNIDDIIEMFGCVPSYIYLFINNKNNYKLMDYRKYVSHHKQKINELQKDINFILSLI